MGILDDAIRQHLDLKRQRGATESELKELEDEAFGPPGRPGDADFPDSEEAPEQSGNGRPDTGAAEPALAQAAPEPAPEPSAGEHPVVEASPEPAEPPIEEEAAPEPTPESEEVTTVYDHTADREAEPDQLEIEPEPAEPSAGAADAPVESLDTVEHALPEEEAEPEHPDIAEEPTAEPDAEAEPEDGEREEDVLADTPDFLRDAPEDDELWFEQGEPKDFDF
jgi:hypothetical protein